MLFTSSSLEDEVSYLIQDTHHLHVHMCVCVCVYVCARVSVRLCACVCATVMYLVFFECGKHVCFILQYIHNYLSTSHFFFVPLSTISPLPFFSSSSSISLIHTPILIPYPSSPFPLLFSLPSPLFPPSLPSRTLLSHSHTLSSLHPSSSPPPQSHV